MNQGKVLVHSSVKKKISRIKLLFKLQCEKICPHTIFQSDKYGPFELTYLMVTGSF